MPMTSLDPSRRIRAQSGSWRIPPLWVRAVALRRRYARSPRPQSVLPQQPRPYFLEYGHELFSGRTRTQRPPGAVKASQTTYSNSYSAGLNTSGPQGFVLSAAASPSPRRPVA